MRAAALKAYAAIGGEVVTADVLAFLQAAKSEQECLASEDVLLARISQPAAADSKIVAQTLRDVIESIEVTHLRGGIKTHMSKDDKYTEWKALQARAGKALLKFHKPETAPIPTFDTLDLDR